MEGNTFVSTRNPKVQIKISDGFIYQGEETDHFGAQNIERLRTTRQRVRDFIFMDATNEAIERFVTVEVANIRGRNWYIAAYSPDPDDFIKTGKTKIGAHTFNYMVYPKVYAEGCFAKHYAKKCGLEMGDWYLLKDHLAVISKRERMYFTYGERLLPEHLNPDGRTIKSSFISDFFRRYHEAVSISK